MYLMYDINYVMPLHAIKTALTEHFWSSVDLALPTKMYVVVVVAFLVVHYTCLFFL